MLKDFTADDFPLLSNWVSSAELLFQFSADTFPFPLRYEDMEAYALIHPERKFYMASQEDGIFGFGEIIPQYINVPRLGRLLIGDPAKRGKGLGKKMVLLLLNECHIAHQATAVELYVLLENHPAIKCYEALGFKFIDEEVIINFNETPKTMKKMRIEFL